MTTSHKVSISGIRQRVLDVVENVLENDTVDPAVDFFDQGVTSLAFMRIVARLNEEYDVAFDVTELEEASIDSLTALVEAQLPKNQ
jgi:acyl carrier protein